MFFSLLGEVKYKLTIEGSTTSIDMAICGSPAWRTGKMHRRRNMILVGIALLLIVAIVLVGRGKKELIIEDGTEYSIVSFGSTDVETKEGNSISAYLITFTYPSETPSNEDTKNTEDQPQTTLTRGTVAVPKRVLRRDSSLAPNAIIWDTPETIEGKTYRTVRWNPKHVEESVTNEKIKEEEPLTRK